MFAVLPSQQIPALKRPAFFGVAVVATLAFTASKTSLVHGDPLPSLKFADAAAAERYVDDSLRGESGQLLFRSVTPARNNTAGAAFSAVFGDSLLRRPGVYELDAWGPVRPFTFIALQPFESKQGGFVGRYRIGSWPAEDRMRETSPYAHPVGFIKATPAEMRTRLSPHFTVGDFVTHDQVAVWPKYVVVREALIDKLELVIQELQRTGTTVTHVTVMSGFRTPQYNATGGNTSGRAELSRHMYGDAADVFVDNDGNGVMDDLNRDGRIDYRDGQVILAAVDRVERAHPDLVGGAGVYRATSQHGPFVHIDVRGSRARWGLVQ